MSNLTMYYSGNIMTNARNRDGFISLQSLALAILAGIPTGTATITERDAIRGGFALGPNSFPLFSTLGGKGDVMAGHAQYDARKLVLLRKNVHTSRVVLALRQFDATTPLERWSRAAKENARRENMARKIGPCALALLGLIPRHDALTLAVEAHKPGNDAANRDWIDAVRWVKAHPVPTKL